MRVIPSEARNDTAGLTIRHENALAPLGERVARDGVFTSRRGPGEGVARTPRTRRLNRHGRSFTPGSSIPHHAPGAIVQEQCGAKTFQAIERLRKLAKQIRKNPDPKLLEAKESAVRELSSRQATEVAHAFSLFFHLVNLCEERERVRRLRAYASQEAGAPMSLRRTFSELRRQEIPAHPAQAPACDPCTSSRFSPPTRRKPSAAASSTTFCASGERWKLCREARDAAAEQAIDPWIEALWLTDEVRESPVTPQIESENARFYLERTIYDLAGTFWEKFCDELVSL